MMNKTNVSLIVVSAFILGVVSSNVPGALAHGGDTNLIHSCVKNSNGSIRIVGANDTCTSNETPLDWSASTLSGSSGGGGVFSVSSVAGTEPVCAGPNMGNPGSCDPERYAPLPADGKLVSLVVRPWRNTTTSAGPAVITVLVNGLPTALQVEIPAGSLATQIVYAEVPVLAGDFVTVQAHDPTGDPGGTAFTATFEYRSDFP